MTRILLVEDNLEYAEAIAARLRRIPNCELVLAGNRDAAISRLEREYFDIVLLDRRIPTSDQVLDEHKDHGWSVFTEINEKYPGTCVWFLTGDVDADFASTLNNEFAKTADVHGGGVLENIRKVFWKKNLTECMKAVQRYANERSLLDRVSLKPLSENCLLTDKDARFVQLFGRKHAGSSVDVESMDGGLSSSRVLKVVVRGVASGVRAIAVAKIGEFEKVIDEEQRYRREVNRLAPGGCPGLTQVWQIADRAALFYGMVGDKVESLFDRLVTQAGSTENIPDTIRGIEKTWLLDKQVRDVEIAQIRRVLLSDPDFVRVRQHVTHFDVDEFESRRVSAAKCVQHNDLHCANIVFDATNRPMIIDFGDVATSFAAVDPVTLELSVIFHPQRSRLPPDWPSAEQISIWLDVGAYKTGCVFPDFVSACRKWAHDEAASTDEIVAVAYAYALRQLKYPNCDKALVLKLIDACRHYFEAR